MHYFMAIYKNNEQSIKETLVLSSNEEDNISFSFPLSQYAQKAGQRKQTHKNNLWVFKNFSKLTQDLLEMFGFMYGN